MSPWNTGWLSLMAVRPTSRTHCSAVSCEARPITIDRLMPPNTTRWLKMAPGAAWRMRSSLKWPSAVFITRLVRSTLSISVTVLPRAWRISRPTGKSSK